MSDYIEERVKRARANAGPVNPEKPRGPFVSPPAGPVPFETVALSTRKGPRGPKCVVIGDAEAYAKFFSGAPPASPAIDWEKEMVLASALGKQPSGAAVEIKSVTFETGYKSSEPGTAVVQLEVAPGDPDAPPLVCPFHVVRLPRFDAQFIFREPGRSSIDLRAVLWIGGGLADMAGGGLIGQAMGAYQVKKGVERLKRSLDPKPTEREGKRLRARSKQDKSGERS